MKFSVCLKKLKSFEKFLWQLESQGEYISEQRILIQQNMPPSMATTALPGVRNVLCY